MRLEQGGLGMRPEHGGLGKDPVLTTTPGGGHHQPHGTRKLWLTCLQERKWVHHDCCDSYKHLRLACLSVTGVWICCSFMFER